MSTPALQAFDLAPELEAASPPEESVPGLLALIEGDHPSGRYQARALARAGVAG